MCDVNKYKGLKNSMVDNKKLVDLRLEVWCNDEQFAEEGEQKGEA